MAGARLFKDDLPIHKVIRFCLFFVFYCVCAHVCACIHTHTDLSGQVAGNETVMIPRAHDSNVDEAAVEYVAGAGASVVNIIVTFPLYKVMFRQQMEGLRLRRAMAQLHGEGLTNIFRGLLPPLIQRTMTVSIMFGSYWQYRGALHDLTPGLPRAVQHCLAAFSAGCTEALLTPLERIQVLLQLKESKLQNTYHAVRELRPHGLKEYYRGVSAIVLRNGISNVLFFSLREPIQKILPAPQTELGEICGAFISGAGLGALLSTIFFPLNVVKNRMQASLGGPFWGIRETFGVIWKERGGNWKKLYRGVSLNYTRSFISWGIINSVYEFMHRHLSELDVFRL